jgi:site-specific recombinase XerD
MHSFWVQQLAQQRSMRRRQLLFHSYAYLLKQQGVNVTTAQRLLGHSDPRVTMSIYTQVLDNEIDDVGLFPSKAAGF